MTLGKIDVSKTLAEVASLLREDTAISPQMRAMVELLMVIVRLFIAKMGINSSNSSIPPSQDPYRRRGRKQTVKGVKRKPGGQNGHKGVRLEQVENPDKTVPLRVDRRTLPPGDYAQNGIESRQVIDIKISRFVTEYQAEILKDAAGNQYVAEFPAGVSMPVQYGAEIKAHAVYMSQHQLIPYNRIQEHFSDQYGIPISAGSIFNFNKEAYNLLEKFEKIAKQQMVKQEQLHGDETGINVAKKLMWLHVISNDRWTLYFPHAKRGEEAMLAMGILENFHGRLCHDHWKPYFQFDCIHCLCNAHHLRELEGAWERDRQYWARDIKNLLLEINDAVRASPSPLSAKKVQKYNDRYKAILQIGEIQCPRVEPNPAKSKPGRVAQSKTRNLLERLIEYESETLRFLTLPGAPFTNNQGENDIRMTKVQQKISGCFRSFRGAQMFCRIRSYLSTCWKNGVSSAEALRILFSGKLPDFIPSAE